MSARKSILRVAGFCAFWFILVFLIGLYANEEILRWVEVLRNLGFIGVIIVVLLYVISCVFLLPLNILTPVVGAIYGFAQGVLIVSASITLGASVAFLVGRLFLRRQVEGYLNDSPQLGKIERAVSANGWVVVFFARLCLLVPFRISNYVFSISRIGFSSYFAATWLGTLPAVSFFVYSGSVVGSVLELKGANGGGSINWKFHGPALVISLIIVSIASKKAKNLLQSEDAIE